jgi:hypothetical protein
MKGAQISSDSSPSFYRSHTLPLWIAQLLSFRFQREINFTQTHPTNGWCFVLNEEKKQAISEEKNTHPTRNRFLRLDWETAERELVELKRRKNDLRKEKRIRNSGELSLYLKTLETKWKCAIRETEQVENGFLCVLLSRLFKLENI